MSEWRDIESAPKDGTAILIAWRRVDLKNFPNLLPAEIVIGYWGQYWGVPGTETWIGTGARSYDGSGRIIDLLNKSLPDVGPTHWQPLPEPPEAK